MKFFRKAATVVTLAAPLLLLAPQGANAAAAAGAIGSGTITPGLTTVATNQSVTFTLSFAAGFNGSAAVSASGCVFVGASFGGETLASGAGSGTLGNCTSGNVSGNVTYTRTEAVVTISGTLTIDGTAYTIGANAFLFVPTSVQPTNSYVLVGGVEGS